MLSYITSKIWNAHFSQRKFPKRIPVFDNTLQILHSRVGLERCAKYLFVVAAVCQVVAILSTEYAHTMAAFCAFECAVGVYWPTIGTLRSKYISDKVCDDILFFIRDHRGHGPAVWGPKAKLCTSTFVTCGWCLRFGCE